MWYSQDQCTPSPLQSAQSQHQGSFHMSDFNAIPAPAVIGHSQAGLCPPPRFPLAGISGNRLMARSAGPLAGTLPGASRERLQQIAEAQQHHAGSRMTFMHKQPKPAPSRQLQFPDPGNQSHSQPDPTMYDSSQQFVMTQPSELPYAARLVSRLPPSFWMKRETLVVIHTLQLYQISACAASCLMQSHSFHAALSVVMIVAASIMTLHCKLHYTGRACPHPNMSCRSACCLSCTMYMVQPFVLVWPSWIACIIIAHCVITMKTEADSGKRNYADQDQVSREKVQTER